MSNIIMTCACAAMPRCVIRGPTRQIKFTVAILAPTCLPKRGEHNYDRLSGLLRPRSYHHAANRVDATVERSGRDHSPADKTGNRDQRVCQGTVAPHVAGE